MIKTLQSTSLVIALLFSVAVQAQDILFEELFDDSTLGQFTPYSVIGDGENWQARDFADKFFAQMNGFNGGIQENEDWLISPALDMDLYDDEVLTFENASNFDGPDLAILVSTDYDGTSDPNDATWTDLSAEVSWSTGGYEYVLSGDLDLSSFEGTGYFAFKYTSSPSIGGKLWQVDSVVVRATMLSTNTNELENPTAITTPIVRNGQLEFTVVNTALDLAFEVCTIEGRQIQKVNRTNTAGDVSIPVADLPKGMYILVARGENFVKGYQFIR